MDQQQHSWIMMTDQQKGLENAIQRELPEAEHRLCVKHLHANWSKRFPRKMMKDMMWKATRAANVPYFEYKIQHIKNVSVEAYEALNRIERKKWTRCAFPPGTQTAPNL
ncbi:hypothetical protein LIER_36226 [Lithospermum erythrorhizon]|uniref:MULE transposase domain-containing protein n=1 Tax=Lithospermum erythrorhizon TaxID=34254 RepID=A0AAV3NWN0_LITER